MKGKSAGPAGPAGRRGAQEGSWAFVDSFARGFLQDFISRLDAFPERSGE
jgi:hypothetical protein